MVYNGNSISKTFTSNPKIDNLAYSLDPRKTVVLPNYINGTGRTSHQTLWINAWDRPVTFLEVWNEDAYFPIFLDQRMKWIKVYSRKKEKF